LLLRLHWHSPADEGKIERERKRSAKINFLFSNSDIQTNKNEIEISCPETKNFVHTCKKKCRVIFLAYNNLFRTIFQINIFFSISLANRCRYIRKFKLVRSLVNSLILK
jgi:hypothetical protein